MTAPYVAAKRQTQPIRIGLVVPAYNEGLRLPGFLLPLCTALAHSSPFAVDLIVVDDGSQSNHRQRMQASCTAARSVWGPDTVHTLRYVRQRSRGGKGGAIRAGWQAASTDDAWLGFVDGDGSASPQEVLRLLSLCREDAPYDAVIGCRYGRQATHRRRSLRALQGRLFAALVQRMTHVDVEDAQCGIKLLRADALRPLLPQLTRTGWLLDIEILHNLQIRGRRIHQEPLIWHDQAGSKLIFGLDAVRMLWGLWTLRRCFATQGVTRTTPAL